MDHTGGKEGVELRHSLDLPIFQACHQTDPIIIDRSERVSLMGSPVRPGFQGSQVLVYSRDEDSRAMVERTKF
eukprot:372438-Hanusia_phi.AAC.1